MRIPYVFQHFKVVAHSIPFFIIFTAVAGKRPHIYSPLAAIKHRRPRAHIRLSCRRFVPRRIISRSGIRRGKKPKPCTRARLICVKKMRINGPNRASPLTPHANLMKRWKTLFPADSSANFGRLLRASSLARSRFFGSHRSCLTS